MYLLDTRVVAELRGARTGVSDPGLALWAAGVPRHDLFLSALSLLELQSEARAAAETDKSGAAALTDWIATRVLPAFEGRILPVDAAVVRRSEALAYPHMRDALLVASALEHRLTLVTRYVSTYRLGKPKLFNPWGYELQEDGEDWRQAARGGSQWFKTLFLRV